MNEKNVAYQISLQSREFVRTHNKEGWLAMFAEDGIIEDPIGKSDLDPTGQGHRTHEQREAFWNKNIANSDIDIVIHKAYTADRECANVVTLTITLNFGEKKLQEVVDGIFTYAVNEEGKLASLRGYWEYQEGLATLKEI